eukprot:scaffold33768_cov112-Isochrysis_galbana.AAC.2
MGQDLGVSVWQLERPPPLLALGRLLVLVCGEERERRAHTFQCLDMCHNSHMSHVPQQCLYMCRTPHPRRNARSGGGAISFFLSRSRIVGIALFQEYSASELTKRKGGATFPLRPRRSPSPGHVSDQHHAAIQRPRARW